MIYDKYCHRCKGIIDGDAVKIYDSRDVCQSCFDSEYICCLGCLEIYPISMVYPTAGLCTACFAEKYC